ncbi:MAG: UDP-N-acetylmuramoyl-tripeptide--D-alanyl-D-alanine ligase [Oscillospiraceae bacterium]|nr:UDP-N-acetylmuramoyl-tripeptide--D-alanyl-D-alanine ligase [Oscillospiraceae bacterium]
MVTTKLGVLLEGVAETSFADLPVDLITTDSRKIEKGCVFIAIVGERFDGNDFALEALEKGAAVAIVSRHFDDVRCIYVPNTLDAYSAMACNYRKQYDPIVVAVTGSVGKTTTKEMVATIFSKFGNTLKNEGNRNNEIGLPESVFRMDENTELAVFEMGMSGLGEISRLSRCALPYGGIITCIGVSHIEMLGSQENILKAKMEILDGMPSDGLLVLNGDDPYLNSVRDDLTCKVATFAIDNDSSDVTARDISCKGFPSTFSIKDKEHGTFYVTIPCSGIHSVKDALAAYTLATRLGLDPGTCAAALSEYAPSGMRQRFRTVRGITVIEDCYNANPDSMEASLKTLADLPCNGIKVAVLGDMLELGDIADDAHRTVGALVATLGIDILLCCGEKMKLAAEAAEEAGVACVRHFEHKMEIAEYLRQSAHSGDMVLFKASRGMALEDIIEEFYKVV